MRYSLFAFIFFLTGCMLDVKVYYEESIPSNSIVLEFDQRNLNFDNLNGKVLSTSILSNGEYVVQLNMEDYIYQNTVKIVSLPTGAELYCSGDQGNLALRSIDLTTQKSFSLSAYYWVSTLLEWGSIENQSLSCWYEVAGVKSNVIRFSIYLQEASIAQVSVPQFTGSESYALGLENGRFSADGSVLAFVTQVPLKTSDRNSNYDVYLFDHSTGEYTLISKGLDGLAGDASSYGATISADGRYIAFESDAENLVAGDSNSSTDVFVYDRQAGVMTRISKSDAGVEADDGCYSPSISEDGRYIAFESSATNLVSGDGNWSSDIFVHDRQINVTTRISLTTAGVEGDDYSYSTSISGDGRYVAFVSDATNLVAGDTNWDTDIFVHDRQTAQTTRVSVDNFGTQADSWSDNVQISSDGRYVIFESQATNLVAGDTNGVRDIFVHDRQLGQNSRVSLDSSGTQSNGWSASASMSSDARYVAFESVATNLVAGDTNAVKDIFVHDRQTGGTSRVSVDSMGVPANQLSDKVRMSADGRYVAFLSEATNLVSSDTNSGKDLFIHERQSGLTSIVSKSLPGVQGNGHSGQTELSISSDGRYVAFQSSATNLVAGDTNGADDIFVHDRHTGQMVRVSVASDGTQANGSSGRPVLSSDGRYVSFDSSATNLVAGDTNGFWDVFVHDLQSGQTTRVSVSSAGVQVNGSSWRPTLSGDGRYVSFDSAATDLVVSDTNAASDIFVHDRQSGQTTRVSVDSVGTQATGTSWRPSLSGDGRYVSFDSDANNLVVGDTNGANDIFVHDRSNGQTTRVSVSSSGVQGSGGSLSASISDDGRSVAFTSNSNNLVAGDSNATNDIFVHDRQSGSTIRVSLDSSGVQGNSWSQFPSISDDGRYVAFESDASNLIAGDVNGTYDVFIHDLQTGITKCVSQTSTGLSGNGGSQYLSISGDGRYIVFESDARNLVPFDLNFSTDVFIAKNPLGN